MYENKDESSSKIQNNISESLSSSSELINPQMSAIPPEKPSSSNITANTNTVNQNNTKSERVSTQKNVTESLIEKQVSLPSSSSSLISSSSSLISSSSETSIKPIESITTIKQTNSSRTLPSEINKQFGNKNLAILPKFVIVIRAKNITESILSLSLLYAKHFYRSQIYIIRFTPYEKGKSLDYDDNPCKSFSFPFCVLQNYDESDHVAFMYSIFLPADFILYLDEYTLTDSQRQQITPEWIDTTLTQIQNHELTFFSCSSSTFSNSLHKLSGCLLTSQALIRKLYSYSSIRKGEIDVMDYLPIFIKEDSLFFTYNSFDKHILESAPHYDTIPYLFKCKPYVSDEKTLAVNIAVYRRPYIGKTIKSIKIQWAVPKFILLYQNSDLMRLDSSIFNITANPIYHVWCSNWNSKYHGKYFFSTLFDVDYAMYMDDDYIIRERFVLNQLQEEMYKEVYSPFNASHLYSIFPPPPHSYPVNKQISNAIYNAVQQGKPFTEYIGNNSISNTIEINNIKKIEMKSKDESIENIETIIQDRNLTDHHYRNNTNIMGRFCGRSRIFNRKHQDIPYIVLKDRCDHVAQILWVRPSNVKVLLRFQQKTFTYGEDAMFSAANMIECQSESVRFYMRTFDTHTDKYRSNYATGNFNYETKPSYKNLSLPYMDHLFIKITMRDMYQFFIDGGYVSIMHKVYNVTEKAITDRHYSFLY
ncbi:hypothetical protein WA158_006571 [Blastocystis sp. Blastoise]